LILLAAVHLLYLQMLGNMLGNIGCFPRHLCMSLIWSRANYIINFPCYESTGLPSHKDNAVEVSGRSSDSFIAMCKSDAHLQAVRNWTY